MKLAFPPELAGFEIRFSVPGAEEYIRGPVPIDGELEAALPAKFYHVAYRKAGGPWQSDPVTVNLDLRDA